MQIHTGRVYDQVAADEGQRVLVDRLWPRGMHRDDPRVGRWIPDVSPSNELRHWYGHEPARYEEFTERYAAELAESPHAEALAEIAELAASQAVLLVTATKDVALSQLPTLVRVLEGGS